MSKSILEKQLDKFDSLDYFLLIILGGFIFLIGFILTNEQKKDCPYITPEKVELNPYVCIYTPPSKRVE